MPSITNREIFKVGKWRGSQTVEATKEYLAAIVQSYVELNSQVPGFAVPIKLGHNKRVGEPAFGYAENVHLSEDGNTVLADFNDVPPEIVDQIAQKKYNTVSVEIWPQVIHDGKTFTNVLSGVALLGAEWPAVKGLKPLSMFAEDGGSTFITLSQEDELEMKTFSETEHDTLMAAAVAVEAAKVVTATERAERAEAALAAFQDEKEKADVTAVITAAEAKGQIVPANKPAVVAMAEAIRLSVDPAKRAAALATFSAFVEALPVKVELANETGGSKQEPEGSEASAGARVDTAVKALMAADKKKTYRVALDEVFAADPELKTAYAEENR